MEIINKIKAYLPIREDINFKFEKSAINYFLAGATIFLLLVYLYGGHWIFSAWTPRFQHTTRTHPWEFWSPPYEVFVALSMETLALASSAIIFSD